MPIFDWECETCGHRWEELVKMDGWPLCCPMDIMSGDVQVETDNLDELEEALMCQARHKSSGSIMTDDGSIIDIYHNIKKLPSKFGKHVSWSQWRALH